MTEATQAQAGEQLTPIDGPFMEALEHFQKAMWEYQVRFQEDKGQGLNETSNALSHLIQYADESLEMSARNKNLDKAANHLIRGCLDLYKLLFLKQGATIAGISRSSQCMLATAMHSRDLLQSIERFKDLGRHARKNEVRNVGVSPLETVVLYGDAVAEGDRICSAYEPAKKDSLQAATRKQKRISLWWAVALALLGEVIILGLNRFFS